MTEHEYTDLIRERPDLKLPAWCYLSGVSLERVLTLPRETIVALRTAILLQRDPWQTELRPDGSTALYQSVERRLEYDPG